MLAAQFILPLKNEFLTMKFLVTLVISVELLIKYFDYFVNINSTRWNITEIKVSTVVIKSIIYKNKFNLSKNAKLKTTFSAPRV